MSELSHPVLSPEEMIAVERDLHSLQAHPLYEYCATRVTLPIGEYWEVNPEVVSGPITHWRRSKTGTAPRYTDGAIKHIQMLAVGHEIHPWFEFSQEEVVFDKRIETDEPLTIDYFLHTGVLSRLNDCRLGGPMTPKPTDWVMNRLHTSGGFNLSAHGARFWLYRRRATHL